MAPSSSWSDAASAGLAKLNPRQRDVFDAALRPPGEPSKIRCLASAGSGKTATVTVLLANGLNRGRFSPERVVVTTFTKKAGEELKGRIGKMADPALYRKLDAQKQIGTFHAICLNWLLRHGTHLAPHKWSPTFNLDTITNPWDKTQTRTKDGKYVERRQLWSWAYQREAKANGIPLAGDAWLFKKPDYIVDDVLSSPETEAWRLKGRPGEGPKSPTWKTDLYKIPGLPLDLKGYYRKRKEETGEPIPQEIPKGRDYLLAIGILRGYAIQPWDTHTFVMTDPVNENAELTFPSARAAADHFGEVFGYPFLFKVWSIYEQIKKKLGAYDFEDTLYTMWKSGDLAADLVIVDEAQDNSVIQGLIAEDIAKRGNGRLIFVADVKQSVYSFRGASPATIRDADESKGFLTLELPTNYRSGSKIVDLGTVCTFNRYPGSLTAPSTGAVREPWAPGSNAEAGRRVDRAALRLVQLPSAEDPQESLVTVPSTVEEHNRTEPFEGSVRIRAFGTAGDEAAGIGQEVASLIHQGVPYEDILLLSRTNRQGTLLEVGLLLQKIPALRVGRGTPFFDMPIVQEILAWLAVVCADESQALPDILANYDDVFMGGATSGIRGYMNRAPKSAREALKDMQTHELTNKFGKSQGYRKALKDVKDATLPWPASVEKIVSYLVVQEDPEESSVDDLEEEPEKTKDLVADKDTDSASAQTMLEITKLFPDYPTFVAFRQRLKKETVYYTEAQLAKMSAGSPDETDEERKTRLQFEAERKSRVYVGTIHSVKGGEAPFVYLSSSLGSFPSARASTVTQISEERRLFYVGVTRARDVLTLTYADRAANGQPAGPSSFLTDYVVPFLTAQQGQSGGAPVVEQEDGGTLSEAPRKKPRKGPLTGFEVEGWEFWADAPKPQDANVLMWSKAGYLLEATRNHPQDPDSRWVLSWVWRSDTGMDPGVEYRASASPATFALRDLPEAIPVLEETLAPQKAVLPVDWHERLAKWLRKAPSARIVSPDFPQGITHRDLANRLAKGVPDWSRRSNPTPPPPPPDPPAWYKGKHE